MQFKQLKRKYSLHVQDGLATCWRGQNPGHLNVPRIIKGHEGEYTQNNGILAYVYEEEFYVTPCSRKAIKALKEAGFSKTGNLFVPFSNGDKPYSPAAQEKWAKIREDVKNFSEKSQEKLATPALA